MWLNFLLLDILNKLTLLFFLLVCLLGQVFDLLHEEGLLLVKLWLRGLLTPGSLLLFLKRLVHALRDLLFLTEELLANLVLFIFGFELNTLFFFQRLSKAFSGGFFSRCQLCFLLLYISKLWAKNVIVPLLLFFQFYKINFEFLVCLFSKLGLKHKAALCCLVEKVGAIGKTVIAELLGKALSIWSLGTFLDEVIEESEDLKVKAL